MTAEIPPSTGSPTPIRGRPRIANGWDLRLLPLTVAMWLATLAGLGWGIIAAVVVASVAAALLLILALISFVRRRTTVHSGPSRHGEPGGGPHRPNVMVLGLGCVLLGCAAAGVSTAIQLIPREVGPLPEWARAGVPAELTVTVTDDPRRARSSSAVRPTYVISARIESIHARGKTVSVRAGAVLLADQRWEHLLTGQRVQLRGKVIPARSRDLTAVAVRVKGPPVRIGVPPWVQLAAGALRTGLQRACAPLPPEQGGLLPGLVVGDVSQLDPAVSEDFRATGMTHLVAVSGANCAIVSGAVLLLCRRLRAPPALAAGLAGVALIGFVILARPSPSVLRAALMGGIALLAFATGRRRAAVPCLLATASLLLLIDPSLAASAGFALSVLATAGLLVLAPDWSTAMKARGIPGGLAEALAVPAAAQLACQPVIVAFFGTIGLVAIPANLLVIPAVAPATLIGVLAGLVSVVSEPLAAALAWLASWPAYWMVLVARTGADVPGGVLPWPAGLVGAMSLLALLIVVVLVARWRPIRWLMIAVVAALVLVALPMRVIAPGWPPPGWLMVGCAVGQGDAVVLNAGDGRAVVIDTGPEPVAVDDCLDRLGIRDIAALVLSHLHADHVGGIAGVLPGRRIGMVLVGAEAEPVGGRRTVSAALSGAGGPPVRVAAVGERLRFGALTLTVVGPLVHADGTRSDPNNNSVVLLASVAGITMLLPGDAEVAEQRSLVAAGAVGRVNVLKVPHHGSPYSDPAFLDVTRPAVAVIEVGAGNDYGHPNPGVVSRLHRGGARVLRTDLDGDVAVCQRNGRLETAVRGVDPAGRSP